MRCGFALFALLALGAAAPAAQPAAVPAPAGIAVQYDARVEHQPGAHTGVMVWADGRGNARSALLAGHGGILMLTRDNVGYVVIDYMQPAVGRQEELAALLVGYQRGYLSRARVERMARQQLEIAEGGTERILGVEGRVYRLTLVEGTRRLPPFEIVVSADPRLAPVGREILRDIDLLREPIAAIAGTVPQPYTAARALFATGTPIRIGPLRMIEMEMRPLSPTMVTLPGPTLSREAFAARLRETIMPENDGLQDAPEEEAPNGPDPR